MKLPTNRFKAAIRERRPQIGIWSSLCSNIAADILGTAGFDWALIDMEHSPNDMLTVLGGAERLRKQVAEGSRS